MLVLKQDHNQVPMNNPFGNLLYLVISLSIYEPISCQPKIWDTCLLGSLVESIYKYLFGIILEMKLIL